MTPGLELNLKNKFIEINKSFLTRHSFLLDADASELTLRGALMIEIARTLADSWYFDYFVDMEYGIPNTPDIIIHSRGQCETDKLVAVELRKAGCSAAELEVSMRKLQALTQQGEVRLGILYAVDCEGGQITMEYYINGRVVE